MVDRLNMFIGEFVTRVRREEGQGMVEYALVLGVVATIAGVAAFTSLGSTIGGMFTALKF